MLQFADSSLIAVVVGEGCSKSTYVMLEFYMFERLERKECGNAAPCQWIDLRLQKGIAARY